MACVALLLTAASGADSRPLLAQVARVAPSAQVMTQCELLLTDMGDLSQMQSAATSSEDHNTATQLGMVAELIHERCVSVHSLLFTFELIDEPVARQKVGQYVALRLEQYAALRGDLTFLNSTATITASPGLAREAIIVRDHLRSLNSLIERLQPHGA